MNITNIVALTSPYVMHFPGKTLKNKIGRDIFNRAMLTDLTGESLPQEMEIIVCVDGESAACSPLLYQCAGFGIPVTVLGSEMNQKEYMVRHHFNKLYLLRDYIASGKARPILLVLDATDTVLSGSPAQLLEKYKQRYAGKIVFGAENHFMYKMAMWNGYAIGHGTSSREEKEYVKRRSEEMSRTVWPWKYLNGGMMIAPRDVLCAAIDVCISHADLVPPGVYKCDQSIWMYLWTVKSDPRIDVDFDCALFQNCNHLFPGQIATDGCTCPPAIDELVDAVYLFCGGDDWSLRCSIASIRENLYALGRIFVIGVNPFIKGTVHIPFGDPNTFNVEANMTRKVLYACANPDISDPFLLLSDDHFIMRPVDAREIPMMYKGDLSRTRAETKYSTRTHNTWLELKRLGLPTMNYNVHCPMPIHKAEYVKALSLVPWDTDSGCGVLCRSIYGNYVGGGEYQEDAKRLAKTAIWAIGGKYLSLPNHGAENLITFLNARFKPEGEEPECT